ncbi:MAG: hypothetical protein M3004_02485 [Bacteroidota bacterium]|nr:hypothetical protein [Bacteroidota bacterium]
MKHLKFCFTSAIMLIFTAAGAQTIKHPLQPPEIKIGKPSPPPPPNMKGHPWTRNGKDVWVVKPPKPPKPPKPNAPPLPPKEDDK